MRVQVTDARARVQVEDTGPGLPPGLEHSIFEPYVRAPGVTQPGLGLGLATMKRFADRHGGEVGAQCTEVGTVFWFELPLALPIAPVAIPGEALDPRPDVTARH